MQNKDTFYDTPPTSVPREMTGSDILWMLLKPLASLQLTIVLFVISLFLVFMGTVAQKNTGIQIVLKDYFYCWISWIDINVFSDFTEVFFKFRLTNQMIRVPFVGGYLLGWAMVINLTAAHFTRFRLTWKRSGIFIIHGGMLLLLFGEFYHAEMSEEYRMDIKEKATSNYMISFDESELAVMSDAGNGVDDVVVIPDEMLKRSAKTKQPISHDSLPFLVKVHHYAINSQFSEDLTKHPIAPTVGNGVTFSFPEEKPVTGVKAGDINMPAIYYELLSKEGKSIGVLATSTAVELTRGNIPMLSKIDQVEVGGKVYRLDFRLKRTYTAFKIRLNELIYEKYPGTEIPKNYTSKITLTNPSTGEKFDSNIWMNHPLRYEGSTFYQSSMDARKRTTGLQVVQYRGGVVGKFAPWGPYVSCALIALGMLVHFTLHLNKFVSKLKKESTHVE
ncbi:MAG: cytochrome c biogenesis protein ResB [Zavarzinella sp.]